MERKIRLLFDFQKFEGNKKLDTLINATHERVENRLSDNELSMVSAAGWNNYGTQRWEHSVTPISKNDK